MKQRPTSRRFAVACCAATTVVLAACPLDRPEDHLARGQEMAAKQDHRGAIIEFKNVLQVKPQSAQARFLLGRELLATGDAKGAEIELQKAAIGKYGRDAVVPLLVKAQRMQNESDKIAAEIGKGELGSAEANAALQAEYGRSLYVERKVDAALAAFRAAQQYVPDYPDALLGEARIDAARGNLDGANAVVASVLAKDPGQVEGLILQGDIARTKGDMKAAVDAYLEATRRDARSISARLDLAGAYIETDALDSARQQLAELKKLAPRDPGATYLDALMQFKARNYLAANDAISLSLSAAPGSGAAHILSGAISIAMNQPAQAEIHLIEGIKLVPNSLYARELLTALYLRQRQPQKASDALQPALLALPNNPDLIGFAGEVALQQGDFAKASTLFEAAHRIDPTNVNAVIKGAGADFARGDPTRGFTTLESATRSKDKGPAPSVALVLERMQHQQFDQALKAWQQLEAEQPTNPVTYNLRAAIGLGLDDRAGARKALEHAVQLQANYFPAVANLAALDELDGDPDAARKRFTTLLAADPKNVSGLVAYAQFEAKHGGSPDVVLPLLQRARQADPTAEQPVTALVAYDAGRGDTAQALSVAQEGLAGAPNNLAYLNLVGDLQMKRGNVDPALATYRRLVAVRPDVAAFQVKLGQAMMLGNQFDLAMTLFENTIRANPDAYEVQAATVGIMLGAGRSADASRLIADIRKTAAKSPLLPELDADAALAGRQYAAATAAYRKLLAQSPTPAHVVKLYAALQMGGDDANARALLADWLESHPNDDTIRTFDADVALQAKDYARAAQGYRAVLKVRPRDALVNNNLAYALGQLKDPAAAGVARTALDLAPDSPFAADTLGWILVEEGEVKRGLELLEKASAAAPAQRDIKLHLAKAQIRDGRRDDARSTLQALLKTAPQSPEAAESRALMATL